MPPHVDETSTLLKIALLSVVGLVDSVAVNNIQYLKLRISKFCKQSKIYFQLISLFEEVHISDLKTFFFSY